MRAGLTDDQKLRSAAFRQVQRLADVNGDLTGRDLRAAFQFDGQRVPLIKPAARHLQADADAIPAFHPYGLSAACAGLHGSRAMANVPCMEQATISELKNRLSEYLDKVRAGHTVLISDGKQPVVRLERVTDEAQGEGRLARLERAGLLRRARSETPLNTLHAAVPKPRQSVTQALLEERGRFPP